MISKNGEGEVQVNPLDPPLVPSRALKCSSILISVSPVGISHFASILVSVSPVEISHFASFLVSVSPTEISHCLE